MNVRLYIWQRATAALMAPLVLVHVAVIFYATRHGLTATDILARTHHSLFWGAFYGVFVGAVSIHASIGVRNVLCEWGRLNDRDASLLAVVLGFILAALGFHAIVALVLT